MLVIYENGTEVIVTTTKKEKKTKKDWFSDGSRKIKNYNRFEIKNTAVLVDEDGTIHWLDRS